MEKLNLLNLAVTTLRNKPSFCKKSSKTVHDFLYNKTKISFNKETISEACKIIRNEFYKRNSKIIYETKPAVAETIVLDFSKKNDKITTPGLYIVLPCVHVPFHNKEFWGALLKYIRCNNNYIEGILIIGDFMDMNSLSAHDKNSVPIQGITLDFEYAQGNKALDELDEAMGRKNYEKFYLFGNHEDRYFRTMKDINNFKYGSSLLSPMDGLRLKQRGYKILSDWKNDSIKVGTHLELVHGEYISLNSAKKHIDTYRKSIVYAHTHRISSYLEGQTAGYNIGFMGDIQSPAFGYATRGMKTSWNNGFAIIHLNHNMFFNVQQIIWYDNSFYVGREKYTN